MIAFMRWIIHSGQGAQDFCTTQAPKLQTTVPHYAISHPYNGSYFIITTHNYRLWPLGDSDSPSIRQEG